MEWGTYGNVTASAIEAAQIAARNEALEEAAKIADVGSTWAYVRKVGDELEPGSPYDRGQQEAARVIAAAIRSLRTPSQQEREG